MYRIIVLLIVNKFQLCFRIDFTVLLVFKRRRELDALLIA